jgi:hypothetical protein
MILKIIIPVKAGTVYNSNYETWQQTWIDNNGGYLALTGNLQSASMILATAERTVPVKFFSTGKLLNRMAYYNISVDSFEWIGASSTDGGINWKSKWHTHYTRKNNLKI